MARAAFYVDGFNLYHSIMSHPRACKCRWLDLPALCRSLLKKSDELISIAYFTAFANWNPGKVRRHQAWLAVLEQIGVDIVLGRFAPAYRECSACGRGFSTYEEKETDVNISTRLLRDGLRGAFDTAYLVTGDSDQAPAIKLLRELAPERQLTAVFSVNRHSNELKAAATAHIQLSWKHFTNNRLPLQVTLKSGKVVDCPSEWR